MIQVQAQHVPAYLDRPRRPGEFWWIVTGNSQLGMSAACPCGCGAELNIYHGVTGTPTYPSIKSVVGCTRGSQWMLQHGQWISTSAQAAKVPEPMF